MLKDRKNFIHFVGTLGKADNDSIYSTQLISTLLEQFWEESYNNILYYCLLPWFGYAMTT